MAIEQSELELVDESRRPGADELNRIVDYVFAHRKDAIKEFLREEDLQVSGTKFALRDRVAGALADGSLGPSDLIGLLDTIEGWGNQHVYLYEAPAGETRVWRSESRARHRLRQIDQEALFNRRRPLVLPDEPTLSSVAWSPQRVRFIWVEKRQWSLRRSDLDREEDGVLYKAYESKLARGITSFDWNLVAGHAALLIQRLPSGARYDEIRRRYEQALERAVHIGDFPRVKVSRAIKKLESSAEIRSRQVAHETQRGGLATFVSRGRESDAFDDPALRKSRDALGQTASVLGNFYWLEKQAALDRIIHTKLYAGDQRVGIFGECTESEVQYVLSRIRHFSR